MGKELDGYRVKEEVEKRRNVNGNGKGATG
jgi:hypothetical protein